MIERSYASRNYLKPLDYKFCIVIQDPVADTVVAHKNVRWIRLMPPKIPGLVDMIEWYAEGMSRCIDAEYFLFVDDDHHYVPGSGNYYQECLDYMDANPDIGFITTHKNAGGWIEDKAGEGFYEPTDGMISLGRGMIMRNIDDFLIGEEELGLKGGLFESWLGFRVMELGYRYVKRLGCPTLKDPSHKVDCGAGPTYDSRWMDRHILGYVRKRYSDPGWHHEIGHFPAILLYLQARAYTKRWGDDILRY